VKTKLLIKEFVQDKIVGAIASTSNRIVEKDMGRFFPPTDMILWRSFSSRILVKIRKM